MSRIAFHLFNESSTLDGNVCLASKLGDNTMEQERPRDAKKLSRLVVEVILILAAIAAIITLNSEIAGTKAAHEQLKVAYEQLKVAYEQLNNEKVAERERLLKEQDVLKTAYRDLVVNFILNGKVDIDEVKVLMESFSSTQELQQEVKAIEERAEVKPEPILIPLTAGWIAQGSGAKGSAYRDGILELQTDLDGGDAYAELFLDLRSVRLPNEIPRNSDGTYNLAGKELVVVVRSDHNFKGEISRPNGAQILLKNGPPQWANLISPWMNVNDAMQTPQGMDVFYMVPDNAVSKEVAGISLKFTIGSGSNDSYEGNFFVTSVTIN